MSMSLQQGHSRNEPKPSFSGIEPLRVPGENMSGLSDNQGVPVWASQCAEGSMRGSMVCSCWANKMLGLVLVALLSISASSVAADRSAPILVWSNRELLASSGAAYESGHAGHLAGQLVLGALGQLAHGFPAFVQADSAAKADLVVLYMGTQVDASALRQTAQLTPVQKLSGLLGAAQSSLVWPFLKYQGDSLLEDLRQQLQATSLGFQTVGCHGQVEDLAEEVRKAVTLDSTLKVLVVCPSTASAPSHSSDALQAEVDQLEKVQAAVHESGKQVVFVYANEPPAQRTFRRSLQATPTSYSGFGPYTKCGPLCVTQVAWLQGMLAILFMTIALCSGLTCLYLLNGPSRFEVMKEGQQNQ